MKTIKNYFYLLFAASILISCGGGEEEATEEETTESTTEEVEETESTDVALDISDAITGGDFIRGAGLGTAQSVIQGEGVLDHDYESEEMDMFVGDLEGYDTETTYEYDEDGNAVYISCSVIMEDVDALAASYSGVVAKYTEKLGERTDGDEEMSIWELEDRLIEVHGYDEELYITVEYL